MSTTVLVVPGIGGSGPQHWQTLWERTNPNFQRVLQRDWNNPSCEAWVSALDDAVQRVSGPVVIVAHSLGCLTFAHWVAKKHSPIMAALLVAVPDPKGANFPSEAVGFTPLPTQCFPFPSIIVASTDDLYGSLAFAETCADAWGSRFVNIGAAGHINIESHVGAWPEGFALLQELRD